MDGAFFRRVWELWNQHSAQRLAAALAYYSLLSLAPLVLIITTLAATIYGSSAAHDTVREVDRLAGAQVANLTRNLLNGRPTSWSGWVATAIGGVIMLFGASSVFAELRDSLNLIWDARTREECWYESLIRERLLAFAMVLALGLVMTLLTIASTLFALIDRVLDLPKSPLFVDAVNLSGTLVVTSIVFTLIFRYVPAIRISWKDAAIGAVATALMYDLARIPLDVYLLHGHVGSAYGAAGSMVAFLFWVYCSAQIFYLGAEFTRVYSERSGTFSRR